MAYPPIVFKKQALDPNDRTEPVVLLPAREMGRSSDFIISLRELDTYFDQRTGEIVKERREGRLDHLVLASYQVRSKPVPNTRPQRYAWDCVKQWQLVQSRTETRGVLHGEWSDGVAIDHRQLSATEHRIRGKRTLGNGWEMSISAKALDERTFELDWSDPDGYAACARLELSEDRNTLFGHYWYPHDGESHDAVKKRRDRLVFLERAGRHDPEAPPAGIWRDVVFEGAGPWPGETEQPTGERYKVWIPVEELERELRAALILNGRTRDAGDKVYLEIGYAVEICDAAEHGGKVSESAPIHCEVPCPYDHEGAVELAQQSIFLHGMLFAQDILPGDGDYGLAERLSELARVLGEDFEQDFDACPKLQEHFSKGFDEGEKTAEDAHVTIAYQYAGEGETAEGTAAAPNPFPPGEVEHWTLNWFRTRLRDYHPDKVGELDPRWAAYLQGRQVYRLREEGAKSMSPEIPDDLLVESVALGMEPQTARAFFCAGWNAAIEQKRHALVKVFASMGYNQSCEHPFKDGKDEPTRQMARDFDLARELLATGRYDEAFRQGEALLRIFEHGQRVGRGRTPDETERLPDYIREQTLLARVDPAVADQLFEQGFTQGDALRRTAETQRWMSKNKERFGKAIVEFCERWHKDQDWQYANEYEAAADWPPIVAMRAELEEAGGGGEIFDHAVRKGVEEVYPQVERQQQRTWLDAVVSKAFNVGEWLGLALWAVVDTISWPVCKVAGWETWKQSGEWAEMCVNGFEESAFRNIGQGDGLLGLWADAFLGLAESFLLVSGVYGLGRSMGISLWRAGVTGFSWKALGSALLLGGARWSAANVAKVLGFNVALSGALGFAEEAAASYFEERDFEIDNATANMLRNTVSFLAFGAMRGVYNSAGMVKLYDRLAYAYMVTGYLQLGKRYVDAWADGDEEAKTECERAFFQQAVMSMLLRGVRGIQSYLGNRSANNKVDLPKQRLGKIVDKAPAVRKDPPPPRTAQEVLKGGQKDGKWSTERVAIDRDVVLRNGDGSAVIVRKNPVTGELQGGVTQGEVRSMQWYASKSKGHVVSGPPRPGPRERLAHAEVESKYATKSADKLNITNDAVVPAKGGGHLLVEKSGGDGLATTELRSALWRAYRTKGHVISRAPVQGQTKSKWGPTSDLVEYRGGLPVTGDIYTPTKGCTPGQLAHLKSPSVSRATRDQLSRSKKDIKAQLDPLKEQYKKLGKDVPKAQAKALKAQVDELQKKLTAADGKLKDMEEPKFCDHIKTKLGPNQRKQGDFKQEGVQAAHVIVDLSKIPAAQRAATEAYFREWMKLSPGTAKRLDVIRTNGGGVETYDVIHSSGND